MSLSRYAKYKDSSVEWLEAVPEHWRMTKLRSFTRFLGGGTPSRENLNYWNGDIPWISPKDMKAERISSAEEGITDAGLAASTTSMIDSGSLLMVVRSGILKHTIPVAINDVPVALNQDMKALRFAESVATSDFFLRWVQGLNDLLLLAWAKQGATVESIEHSYLAETLVPLPPVAEQVSITTFLDRETAKIDALIAEQETLLALLAEKRQATISHAVTRGLDPNAPMKDSGVPWLGEVPAHWEMLSLKKVVVLQRGHDLPSELREEGSVPVISSGGYIGFHSSAQAKGPGIVTGRYGSIGSFVYVEEEDYWPLNTALYSIELYDNLPRYVWYLLQSLYQHFLLNSMKTAVPGIDRNDIHVVTVAKAPRKEQELIVRELDATLIAFDGMSRKVERAIELLGERRSALISAAVTGKIDVRELAGQVPG